MFQSSDLFKNIECPFFKHDLCHRPYCHFKHIKSKKEKEKEKSKVLNSNADEDDPEVVEIKAPSSSIKVTQKERPPSPIEDVNEEILNIITKYKSKQDAPSPIDEVNDEILKIVMKYKSHKEAPPPPDEVNDEILKIVMKYKSKQETSSPSDVVTDDILNIVKNISPTKLMEYAKRKQEVQELQKVLDQVDKETKGNAAVDTVSKPRASEKVMSGINKETVGGPASSEEDIIKGGLIDSFYSKAKVQVNITSGDLDTKPSNLASSKVKAPTRRRSICNCDDPDCSGFREELSDNQFMHTSVNLNEIEDEYMRRKMQRRLERKKKILSVSETFSSFLPGADEKFNSSTLPETNGPFPVLPTTSEISVPVPPRADTKPVADATLSVVPVEAVKNAIVDIRESDFFIPSIEVPEDPEPEEGMDLDLSKYIDKCKEEYAKKRKEKTKGEKKNILTPGVVSDATPDKEEIESDVKESKKRGALAEKMQNVDVEIKKTNVDNEDNDNNKSGTGVKVKKKRRIILPVEEGTVTPPNVETKKIKEPIKSNIQGERTKEQTSKLRVTFADEVSDKPLEVVSSPNNKCVKEDLDVKVKSAEKPSSGTEKSRKDPHGNKTKTDSDVKLKSEGMVAADKSLSGIVKSHTDSPGNKMKSDTDVKHKSESMVAAGKTLSGIDKSRKDSPGDKMKEDSDDKLKSERIVAADKTLRDVDKSRKDFAGIKMKETGNELRNAKSCDDANIPSKKDDSKLGKDQSLNKKVKVVEKSSDDTNISSKNDDKKLGKDQSLKKVKVGEKISDDADIRSEKDNKKVGKDQSLINKKVKVKEKNSDDANIPSKKGDRNLGKDQSLKKVKVEEKVKTSSAVNDDGKQLEKVNLVRKDKTSVNKSTECRSNKHENQISMGKPKSENSEKQISMQPEQAKKVKLDDSLNYFDTRERDNVLSKSKNDSKKDGKVVANLEQQVKKSKSNKVVNKKHDSNTSTSEEKKKHSDRDQSIDSKEKSKNIEYEGSSLSRNAFDIIAISSSEDDEIEDEGAAHMSEDQVFSEDDHNSTDYEEEVDETMKENIEQDIVGDSGSHGENKKRIALTNEVIHRKPVQPHKSKSLKMSYVSPGLRSTGVGNCASSTPVIPNEKETSTPDYSHSKGKKRISHVKSLPVIEKEVDDRPKLEMDVGGKIPHLLRQKYFDKIIDELIPKVAAKQLAYDRAIADELDAYKRSTRKPLYMNLCANIVKRIRSMPDYIAPKEKPKADPMKTGQPTMFVRTDAKGKPKADPMRTGQPTVKSVRSDAVPSTKTNINQVKGDNSANVRIKSVNIAGYQKVEGKTINSKACIKPASSALVNALSDKVVLPKKRERSDSLSLEPLELTEDNFYEHMKQYMLTKEQLWEHKFPKRDPDNPELTIIKDYVPSSNNLKRLCCRCGKEYFMNKKGKYVTRNECHFHWGKLLRQRGRNSTMVFTCCGADASGSTCAMCRLHVSNKVGPLVNYVSTSSCKNKDSRRKVFALDCEMCYTTQGLELTRLTAIDFDLEQIIDLFVKPTNPIVDYNTRFSGVTREDLQDVTTNINDIHDILLNMVDKDTILLGHSLESDLNALNLIHEKVVDTSVVFPHRLGLPLKRALRNLMAEYLQKVIQSGEGGHDSCEDARSCMELMKYKFKEDQKARKRLKLNSSTQ